MLRPINSSAATLTERIDMERTFAYAPAVIPKAVHYLEKWTTSRWVVIGTYESYSAAATAMYQTSVTSFFDVMRIRDRTGKIVG